MHEAFSHLVDIFIGEALHGKNVNNSKFRFVHFYIIFWPKKPNLTVFSTIKDIVSEMHEAFSHLVDILVAGEFLLQKCKKNQNQNFFPFSSYFCQKSNFIQKLCYSVWSFKASCNRKIITQGKDYHSIKA